MMSTVLPSESLLSHANNNPLIQFNGGFTPWENLESFFTSTEHKANPTLENNKHEAQIKPISKSKLSRYHADMNIGSASSNKKTSCLDTPNLTSYHANSDLDLEIIDKQKSTRFNEPNLLGCHHGNLDLGSKSPDLSCHHASLNLGSDGSPNHKTSFDDDQLSPNSVLPTFVSGFGSDNQNQNNSNLNSYEHDQSSPNSVLLSSSSGSDDPNQNQKDSNMNTCPNEQVKVASVLDERKRKRKISNRESARRSRMRKQRHVETLRNDVNQLKIQTRERSNQLRLMNHHIQFVRRENDRLKAESIILQRKLVQLAQYWQLQQLQQRSYYHPSTPSCTAMQRII